MRGFFVFVHFLSLCRIFSLMAYYSIEKRQRADGTLRYRCTVGVKEGGKYIYRENRTFSKQAHAKTWGTGGVAELETNGVPTGNDLNKMAVGDLLKSYINDPNLGCKAGRTKRYVLDMLLDCDISEIPLTDLSTSHVIEHCRQRNGAGAGPSTVNSRCELPIFRSGVCQTCLRYRLHNQPCNRRKTAPAPDGANWQIQAPQSPPGKRRVG